MTRRRDRQPLWFGVFALLAASIVIFSVNYHVVRLFFDEGAAGRLKIQQRSGDDRGGGSAPTPPPHKIAGLSCANYGGPSDDDDVSEMVYWRDVPSDASFVSPFKEDGGGETKYLSFEPDQAGWNNVRMGMETVLAMAHAMGRTLVLPPHKEYWNLNKGDRGQQKRFSFDDFFHFESLSLEHAGLDVITMDEFLRRVVAKGGKFFGSSEEAAQHRFPPRNRTDWDDVPNRDQYELWRYLRTVGHVEQWDPDKSVLAFPSTTSERDAVDIRETFDRVVKMMPNPQTFKNKPVPVDGTSEERLREMISNRRKLVLYEGKLRDATLIHVKEDWQNQFRLLTHFYGFLHFQSWKQDLWTKRFVRDHLRYNDEIMCAAGRVVRALRLRSKSRNGGGAFDAMHVRRADFGRQFKHMVVTGDVLLKNVRDVLRPNATVYVATDESDKRYFDPLNEHYDVVYLENFLHVLKDVNTNLIPFIEQVVASRGRTFVGLHLSTYTAYVNRLRGYYSVSEKREGHEMGILDSYHYWEPRDKHLYRNYFPFTNPSFVHEFPTAWRGIDRGTEEEKA